MTDFAQQTIGDLVAEDYRRATAFKKHGIDFCCGGGLTVQAACEKKGIPLAEMERALSEAEQHRGDTSSRPGSWALDFLADYIVNEHHSYVRENIPHMMQYARKVARVHSGANPELVEIARLFEEVADEMTQHMMKEEQVLFPHIKALAKAQQSGTVPKRPPFGTVCNPIRAMEHDHDRAGELMRQIRTLSSDFTPPEHACNTYRVFYAKLEEFEDDLHRHVHLENNILFPKAAALEEELTARQHS